LLTLADPSLLLSLLARHSWVRETPDDSIVLCPPIESHADPAGDKPTGSKHGPRKVNQATASCRNRCGERILIVFPVRSLTAVICVTHFPFGKG